jgi:hypothetical protein
MTHPGRPCLLARLAVCIVTVMLGAGCASTLREDVPSSAGTARMVPAWLEKDWLESTGQLETVAQTSDGLVFLTDADVVDRDVPRWPVSAARETVFGGLMGGVFAASGAVGAMTGGVVSKVPKHVTPWTQAVPGLSWPLPAPSARLVLPRETGAWAQQRKMKVGDIAVRVQAALTTAGYSETSFYNVPDGFVIVTRLEQTERDGTAKSGTERWNVEAPGQDDSFFLKVLKGMTGATSGNYRLFIFVVSTDDRPPTAAEPSFGDAKLWFLRGSTGLAAETASRPVTAAHRMSVLVYEFEAITKQKVLARAPGLLTCEDHLVKAGLWQGLATLAGRGETSTSLALARAEE